MLLLVLRAEQVILSKQIIKTHLGQLLEVDGSAAWDCLLVFLGARDAVWPYDVAVTSHLRHLANLAATPADSVSADCILGLDVMTTCAVRMHTSVDEVFLVDTLILQDVSVNVRLLVVFAGHMRLRYSSRVCTDQGLSSL